MKQKSYKLKINNKNIRLLEAGPGSISTAVMSSAKEVGEAAGDALKITGAFLKKSWGATFGYVKKIYTNYRKTGNFTSALESANKEMVAEDKQIANEMKQLINAQPGTKDANLFLSMTCPAARAYNVFVDKEFIKQKYGSDYRGSGENERAAKEQSKKAYYNIITAISHISHGTSTNAILKNSEKLDRGDRKEGKEKKYTVEKVVEKNKDRLYCTWLMIQESCKDYCSPIKLDDYPFFSF